MSLTSISQRMYPLNQVLKSSVGHIKAFMKLNRLFTMNQKIKPAAGMFLFLMCQMSGGEFKIRVSNASNGITRAAAGTEVKVFSIVNASKM